MNGNRHMHMVADLVREIKSAHTTHFRIGSRWFNFVATADGYRMTVEYALDVDRAFSVVRGVLRTLEDVADIALRMAGF